MTARILVVDDIPANVKLLETRLVAEYFEVLTANDGQTALDICQNTHVDLILLDVMMPGIDGFEVCKRLKANPRTMHIPVVMVTALDQPADCVEGLKCGADDFLTKPVNDLQLLARVKSLLRLKLISDELRNRAGGTKGLNAADDSDNVDTKDEPALVLLVDGRASSQERIGKSLAGLADIKVVSDPETAIFEAGEMPYELVIVNDNIDDADAVRLCSQLRSGEGTRMIPLLIMLPEGDDQRIIKALDIGVNDYICQPFDPNELYARSVTQIKRSRCNQKLRQSLSQSVELAVVDPLTGLNNRRFLDMHMDKLIDRAARRGQPLSLFITDIDKFKNVNDTYGHDGGDEILREFARRLRSAVRGADLACRFGGEEFIVVMPNTNEEIAIQIAERLREVVEGVSFSLPNSKQTLAITTSVGVASYEAGQDTASSVLKRADEALYQAKSDGRNRVVCKAA